MNGEFSENIRRVIAKRASERCTLCSISTSKPHTANPSLFANLGEAAHIRGANFTPHNRYDAKMTNEERASIDNALWVCRQCHKKIDSDSAKFTTAFLLNKKRIHEENVFLGKYDIQWKDYKQLKERINELQKLIHEKEQNQILRDKVSGIALSQLKIELERVTEEKAVLERNYELLKNTASGFAGDSADHGIHSILSNIEAGEFQAAKAELSISKLEEEEQIIARKRVLRANLEEIDKNYDDAEADYRKATEISGSREFVDDYISYLLRRGKGKTAMELCQKKLNDASLPLEHKIWLNTALGEIASELHDSELAIRYLTVAKSLIESTEPLSVDDSLAVANILIGLGVAYKKLGQHDTALNVFQNAYNLFQIAVARYGVHQPRELADLHVNVAGLYLDNNDPETALKHYTAAEAGYKEGNDHLQMIIVGLNAVDAFTHHKIRDVAKARELLEKVKSECEQCYSQQPLYYLKYYAGALSKSAIFYANSKDFNAAHKEMAYAIELYQDAFRTVGLIDETVVISLYTNFAEILCQMGQPQKAQPYYRDAIELAEKMPDSSHEKHLDLARIYAMRAETLEDNVSAASDLETAYKHIQLCNIDRVLMARVWKIRIEKLRSSKTQSS